MGGEYPSGSLNQYSDFVYDSFGNRARISETDEHIVLTWDEGPEHKLSKQDFEDMAQKGIFSSQPLEDIDQSIGILPTYKTPQVWQDPGMRHPIGCMDETYDDKMFNTLKDKRSFIISGKQDALVWLENLIFDLNFRGQDVNAAEELYRQIYQKGSMDNRNYYFDLLLSQFGSK